MKKNILIVLANLFFLNIVTAQEYNASLFGCVSDGITNNTKSIQYAIDFIAEKGGGKLNFYVGRYLTGSLSLKSNVTVELHEGAVLLASPNMNDYLQEGSQYALLFGENISNFSLIGKGVIEAQSNAMDAHLKKINDNGLLVYKVDNLPNLLTLVATKNSIIDGIIFLNGGNNAIKIIGGENNALENLIINAQSAYSGGIYLENTKNITLKNLYVDVLKKPLYKIGATTIKTAEKSITPNGKSLL